MEVNPNDDGRSPRGHRSAQSGWFQSSLGLVRGGYMRRHPTSRPAPGRGMRSPSEAGSVIWRMPPFPLSRAAARECASRLMAPGTALTVPRLAIAALEPFQPPNTYSGAFGLARNLLLAGIGRPED